MLIVVECARKKNHRNFQKRKGTPVHQFLANSTVHIFKKNYPPCHYKQKNNIK
jgi:hypothetical protein